MEKTKIHTLFNVIGLSSLGGAIFLQILVFSDILTQGYFKAVEGNPVILAFEILLTSIAAFYFINIYQRFLREMK